MGVLGTVYDTSTEFNAMMMCIKNSIEKINTALPVRVEAVYPDEMRVDVVPLVGFWDFQNDTVEPVTLYNLPYMRVQGGIAALVIDPVVGDIGFAIFAQKDSSGVVRGTDKPVKAGSYRRYSMSDGWYIGGFLNQNPKIFLEMKQDETAILTAVKGTTINVNAGGLTINGNVTVNGRIDATSDITAGGGSVTMLGHTHTAPHGETTTGHG